MRSPTRHVPTTNNAIAFDGFDDYKRVAVASRHTELDATEQDLTDARRDMSRYLRDFQPTKAWTHDVVRLLRRLW